MQVEDSARVPTPIDDDGVRTVTVGTGIYGIAALVTAFTADSDIALTCLAGFLLGLIGIYYCVRRRNAIARDTVRAGSRS